MAATLSWHLKSAEWEGVPRPVQDDLETYLSDNARLAFRQASELASILGQFDAEGVLALPRCGALVDWLLYENLTLWDLENTELLVPAPQMKGACAILESRGYRVAPHSRIDSGSQRLWFLSDDGAIHLSIALNPFKKGRATRLDSSDFGYSSSSISFAGRAIRMPNPEMFLLLLCASEGQPVRIRLKKLCDVATVLQKHAALDQRGVMRLAASYRLKGTLHTNLRRARALLRVPAPGKFAGELVRAQRVLGSIRHSIPSDFGEGCSGTHRTFLGTFAPTPIDVARQMLALGTVGPGDLVCDLGCGDGRLVNLAASSFGARGVGFDIDPQRIQEAQANARDRGVAEQTRFLLQDALSADLTGVTVVLLYVLFSSHLALRPKLQRELRPGARIISRRFGMADWAPDMIETCSLPDGSAEPIFLWRIGR